MQLPIGRAGCYMTFHAITRKVYRAAHQLIGRTLISLFDWLIWLILGIIQDVPQLLNRDTAGPYILLFISLSLHTVLYHNIKLE